MDNVNRARKRLRPTPLLLLVTMLVSSPAFAQVDLSGEWAPIFHEDQPERVPGPELGDYLGLPINDAARLRAETWDASIMTLPEWQCRPHSADYIVRGPSQLRIWKEVNPVTRGIIAWHAEWLRTTGDSRQIYMDGRPHPPEYAAHTWAGFSTAKWEGDMLTITTTHLKEGYVRRNGIPRSDKATLTEHLMRRGEYLTWVTIVTDPVYLTEPLIRTTEYAWNLRQQIAPYPCDAVDEVERQKGTVPHHLPGTNTFLTEFPSRHGLPAEAAMGGAETMYPDYRLKLKTSAGSQQNQNRSQQNQNADNGEVHVLPVRGNVYMLIGAGGNITVEVHRAGVLLVDTGVAQMSDKVLAAVRQLSSHPVTTIINTHVHGDHTGGNEKIAAAGVTVTGGNVAGDIQDAAEGAAVIAHENVLNRMSAPTGRQAATPARAWPTDTYFGGVKTLTPYYYGDAIQIIHQPAAHTDGDSIVFFRRADVISAGDIFSTTSYPVIDLERGGGIQGIIDGLNRILDLAIPEFRLEGGTMVIPGHGRLCDAADVAYYRDMVTIIRDRVKDMIRKGMTLEQVKAAKPTRDYDLRYGAETGSWTTAMFVEAVYKSLMAKN